MILNKERGQALIELLKTVPEDKFNMGSYRANSSVAHKCNTIGCAVGWATELDTEENFKRYIISDFDKQLVFTRWSYDFFFGEPYQVIKFGNDHWDFLFSQSHEEDSWNGPTISHAIARIEWLLADKPLPDDWEIKLEIEDLFYMVGDSDSIAKDMAV